MKLLVIGDLHGQVPHVDKTDADAIIVPGDVFGDEGFREHINVAYQQFLDGEDVDWVDVAGEQEARRLVDVAFDQACAVMDHLSYLNVPIVAIPGNWDRVGAVRPAGSPTWDDLVQRYPKVIDADLQLVSLDGIDIIGAGRMNGPELGKLRGYDEDMHGMERRELAREIVDYADLFKKTTQPVMLLSHNVPYNTPLDKIRNKDSLRDGWHYGSVLARRLIENHSPALCVAGHMHETFGTFHLGNTLCINAGFGPDKKTIIELSGTDIQVTQYPEKKAKQY